MSPQTLTTAFLITQFFLLLIVYLGILALRYGERSFSPYSDNPRPATRNLPSLVLGFALITLACLAFSQDFIVLSKMHRGIVTNPSIDATNVDLLNGATFAFICIDAGEAKRLVVEKLEAMGVPFIDVGMGLELVEGSLGGILRVTTSTPGNRAEARKRISFAGGGEQDVYSSNIQVADLNALNAVLAIVKWKKLLGFYRDLEGEHHCTYTTDGNMLLNGDGE